MSPYEFLEHTADVVIEARGVSAQEMFQEAAQALTAYVFGEGGAPHPPAVQVSVTLESADRSELLVEWLSWVLTQCSIRQSRAVTFSLTGLTDTALTGSVGFAPATAHEEIKAVTYHDLWTGEDAGEWIGRVTVDL